MKTLPDRCKFFRFLKDECIIEKKHSFAIDVSIMFKLETMGYYYDIYLKTNVLLLASVFEKFINVFLEYYGLDLCNYFRSPGLSWDVMLKITEIKLELISDIDMYLFAGEGMRGSISYILKRFIWDNNKYLKFYDDTRQSKYTMYLDANNLCGWALSQCRPYSKFKLLNQKEIHKFDVNLVSENGFDGYIKIDLKYLEGLHELDNDHSLVSEKVQISHDMLSKYCSNIANKYGKLVILINKLIPNLDIKDKYVLHCINLQLHLSIGMKLLSVHRILKFKQSDWLKKLFLILIL